MKNKLFKILPYVLFATFLAISGILFTQNSNLKSQITNNQAIPLVELNNYLSFNEEGVASGSLTGFVKFNNIENQPKRLKQYVTITAHDAFDPEYGQFFSVTDTIAMAEIAPRRFDPVPVFIKRVEGELIIFSDAEENLYGFNNDTGEAFIFDNTGDNTSLITDSMEYRKFMIDFLK